MSGENTKFSGISADKAAKVQAAPTKLRNERDDSAWRTKLQRGESQGTKKARYYLVDCQLKVHEQVQRDRCGSLSSDPGVRFGRPPMFR